ncbi:MAG: FMN-binding protein [Methanosarcinales archaeon]|nr:MAG: FMN-binding protein [Methanosarcinales archaeon]
MGANSEDIRKAVGTIAKLTLIVVIAASVLTVTYEVTERRISANNELAPVFSQVMPGAAQFKPVVGEGNEIVYYEAYNEEGRLIGYTFVAEKEGFKGPIEIVGGVDLNYKVTAIMVIKQTETPGLGAKIATPGFQGQFSGVSVEELNLSPEGKIDAVTGATISSQAVVDAIREKVTEIETG